MGSGKVPLRSAHVGHLSRPPSWLFLFALVFVCGLAFGLRCLHLLNDDHYFIVSPDSHYFHRMAQLLVEGQTYFYPTHYTNLPITMFSGITYPLAAFGRGVSWLIPLSSGDALELASKLLPPALGVVTAIMICLAVSRLYNRTVGLFSSFAWAVAYWAIVHQAAGYLDRDCLSLPLVVSGVFLFFFLSESRSSAFWGRSRWVLCALAVVGIEALLYLEWGFLGPVILLSVVAAFFLLQVLNGLMVGLVPSVLREEDPFRMVFTFAKGLLRPLPAILKGSLSRTMAMILGLNLVAAAFQPEVFGSIRSQFAKVFGGALAGEQTVQELRGATLGDVMSYSLLLIPVLMGIYVCVRRRNRADLLLLAWLGVLFVGGLFAIRLFIYAAPAVCMVSGVGLAALIDVNGFRPSLGALLLLPSVNPRGIMPYLRVGSAVILIVLVVLSATSFSYRFASSPPTAADSGWQDALVWLREETDQDAVIMTWWDYGYWVLDIAQRVPVVDNGWHSDAKDMDISRVYLALDDAEAVGIMSRHGADYLVFSIVETRILPSISLRVLNAAYGDGTSIPGELQDSLYGRSFADAFDSDSGLRRVFQSPDSSVVILMLI